MLHATSKNDDAILSHERNTLRIAQQSLLQLTNTSIKFLHQNNGPFSKCIHKKYAYS